MGNLLILAAVNAALWLIIFVFLYKATNRQQSLQQELRALESLLADSEDENRPEVRPAG